jgi:hypothetical protein
MASTESDKNWEDLPYTMMVKFEQANEASTRIAKAMQTTVSFYTPFARRKLKKNFYYLSLALVERARNLPDQIETLVAYEVFSASLKKLKQEPALKDYLEWEEIIHELQCEEVKLILLLPRCTSVLRTFQSMDKFLKPVYAAFGTKKISKDELDVIKNLVEVSFDTFKGTLNEMMPV